ncbi:hypothetical protein [Nocardia asiatica]|uniref:hypothetical protein n=1 Tax=Nocardia asiatica TaxID=209252 RepID=UPI0024547BA4|nr:hypothetical protein [Nocardia asiatica]
MMQFRDLTPDPVVFGAARSLMAVEVAGVTVIYDSYDPREQGVAVWVCPQGFLPGQLDTALCGGTTAPGTRAVVRATYRCGGSFETLTVTADASAADLAVMAAAVPHFQRVTQEPGQSGNLEELDRYLAAALR